MLRCFFTLCAWREIIRIKKKNPESSHLLFHNWKPVLASWMRLKYPHIAIGALASSAPILQFEDVVPAEIFYDLVSNGFKVSQSHALFSLKAFLSRFILL